MSNPESTYHFDYIIAGAGLAGLTLAHHLINSPLGSSKMLVVDQDLTPKDDKAWSFWYRGFPPFQSFIHASWDRVQVSTPEGLSTKLLSEYSYHSIKSGAFRKAIIDQLNQHPSVRLMEASIEAMGSNKEKAWIDTQRNRYTAPYIFQSYLQPPSKEASSPHYPLLRHYAGWDLTASKEVFDSLALTFMDFDLSFKEGVAFIHLLPWSSQKAWVEYTIFSNQLKEPTFYHEKLEIYLYNQFGLKSIDYTIRQNKQGSTPMRDRPQPPWYASRILNIGNVSGFAKPSTGHAFARIQRHCKAIVQQLAHDGTPALPDPSPFRYRMYDLWLLHIIKEEPQEAVRIFQQLFKQHSIDIIFQFLSEQSTYSQDLNIIKSLPPAPFLNAMWESKKQLFKI